MSTIAELQKLSEREDHIEYKEAKHNYPFSGGERRDVKDRRHCVLGYIVALANERGGRLVLGMADKVPHEVVGSDFAQNALGGLVDEIYKRLHIRVRTEELYDGDKRVLVITVPSRPTGKALRFEGVPLMRTGESLREMDDAEYLTIIQEQDPDFSAKECQGLLSADLDGDAIRRLRQLIFEKRKNPDILTSPQEQLFSDLRLVTTEGRLTYAALILVGKSSALETFLPQNNIVVEYRSNHSLDRYSARKEFRLPLMKAVDEIWNYISHPASNPILHINDMPVILDVPGFNEETIREAVLNACVHRSFQMPGDILIKIFPDSFEISNPGGFPFGVNVGNILTVNSSPRNRLLAEIIEKTGLIERSGQGADIMFRNCVAEGKPLPDYSESDDYQVSLKIPAEIENPRLYIFLRNWAVKLNAFELLNLYYVNKGRVDDLFVNSLSRLLDAGVIDEDVYFRYTFGLTYFVYAYRDCAAQFGADVVRQVYYAIKRSGRASSSFIAEQLKGKYSLKQSRTLIAKMCEAGYLVQKGSGRASVYEWVEK
ncbi:MAG: putative DNA binding domain-containing protein [Bacteroidales bacterium]|nr:putative DNA binding domain-containing protein [Bacteroidales bacterium]